MLTANSSLLRKIAKICLDIKLKFSWVNYYDEAEVSIIFKSSKHNLTFPSRTINISFYSLGFPKAYQVWVHNFQYDQDKEGRGITKSWNLGVYDDKFLINLFQKIKTDLNLRVYENPAL